MNEELKNILNKVRCLYLKYGIKSVTMDDVARELGMSKKTLYQYVKDKNELVSLVMDLEIESHQCFSEKIHAMNLSAIDEVLEIHKQVNRMIKERNPSQEYDLRKYYPEQYQKIMQVSRERIYNNIRDNIRKGKEEGVYRAEVNEEIIAKVQLMRLENSVFNEAFTVEEMTSPKFFLEIFVYHIRGIANEKGIKELESKLKLLENN
ncbi:MAG: TetR/AcrR family transcriptional regulator [Bacteroidota bacterium]|nr:TetR/AcrR family transcriptional regulator [Bacteroidota bacterium]